MIACKILLIFVDVPAVTVVVGRTAKTVPAAASFSHFAVFLSACQDEDADLNEDCTLSPSPDFALAGT